MSASDDVVAGDVSGAFLDDFSICGNAMDEAIEDRSRVPKPCHLGVCTVASMRVSLWG